MVLLVIAGKNSTMEEFFKTIYFIKDGLGINSAQALHLLALSMHDNTTVISEADMQELEKKGFIKNLFSLLTIFFSLSYFCNAHSFALSKRYAHGFAVGNSILFLLLGAKAHLW